MKKIDFICDNCAKDCKDKTGYPAVTLHTCSFGSILLPGHMPEFHYCSIGCMLKFIENMNKPEAVDFRKGR